MNPKLVTFTYKYNQEISSFYKVKHLWKTLIGAEYVKRKCNYKVQIR